MRQRINSADLFGARLRFTAAVTLLQRSRSASGVNLLIDFNDTVHTDAVVAVAIFINKMMNIKKKSLERGNA